MAKPKRSSGSGLRKPHGPKRHMFKELKPMVHYFGQAGMLTKYNCEESFILACQARGVKNPSHADWMKFSCLKTIKDKDAFFAALNPKKAESIPQE